jgi:hypothetical protein
MRLPFVKNIWGVVVAGLLCVRGADALISANKLCKSFPVQSPSSALLLAVRPLFRPFLLAQYQDRSSQRGKSAVIQACLEPRDSSGDWSFTDTDSVTYCSEAKGILVNEFDIQYHKNNQVSTFDDDIILT